MWKPKWVVVFYNKFGIGLQAKYDRIKSWELPPVLDAAFDKLWEAVAPDIKKALWAVVNIIYKKFGPDKAKEMLKSVIDFLSNIFLKKDDK